jgi:hypothetical protein
MNNIPNLIKQPAVCCIHCGKYYKKKSNLQKHIILCEIYTQGIQGNRNEEDTNSLIEEMSDTRKLYSIIQQLVLKCNSMEKQIRELKQKDRIEERRIQKIEEDLIYSNTSVSPSFEFEFIDIPSKIDIQESDIDNMIHNESSFYEILYSVLHRDLSSLNSVPLKLIRKKMVVFEFIDKEANRGTFVEPTYEKMLYLANKLHNQICKKLFKWREKWQERMDNDCLLQDKYDIALLKIMKIDRKKTEVHNKIKKILEICIG